MLKVVASLFVIFMAAPASAQSCPDFFRFVDFGLKDRDGTVHRGGPHLRAESLEGRPLLLRELSECLPVRDMSVDGHGNPIPVVAAVTYDPAKTGIDLTALHVKSVQDTVAAAQDNAADHLTRLGRLGAQRVQQQEFLCVTFADAPETSCQLTSPYPGNVPLVVYCDRLACDAPVLAVNDQVIVQATWDRTGQDPETLGHDILTRIRQIREFLDPLSSAF